jgi:hypothetical protein
MAPVRGQRFLDRVVKVSKLEVSVMATSRPIKQPQTLHEYVKHQIDTFWSDFVHSDWKSIAYVSMCCGVALTTMYELGLRAQLFESIAIIVMMCMAAWVSFSNMEKK